MIRLRTAAPVAVLVAGLALAGCSSTEKATTAASTAAASVSAAASTAAANASSAASGVASKASSAASSASSAASAATAPKVNANTATTAQIATALEKAGVKNADKMADEIEEYRPYTADNIKSKLTKELGKYNVDNATIAKILSVLTV